MQNKWRASNSHNETFLAGSMAYFDMSKISVGKRSYGPITVQMFGSENEGLIIGNYVSIASGVTFLLGGNHPYNGISTYPFKVKLLGQQIEAVSKGPVVIEDDVWIGLNSLILSGVRIGKGAVIAAGTVLTKCAPPYSIVAGNPARIVKFRFEQEVIKELCRLDFSKIDEQTLIENKDILYQQLNKDNVKSIVDRLMNQSVSS